VRHTPRKLGNIGDKRPILVAPKDDDFKLVHYPLSPSRY
jgi:hypothetical protein